MSGLGVEKGGVGQQAIFFTLEDVDKLTYAGLKMLRPYLSTEETFTVLTYFRRSANVRVLPYAPVALIGVPLTGIGLSTEGGVSTDLLAIPHRWAIISTGMGRPTGRSMSTNASIALYRT